MNAILNKEKKYTKGKADSILEILAYFSIFNYPLSEVEIKRFLPPGFEDSSIADTLKKLEAERSVFKMDEFYSLENHFSLIERRREGNLRAQKLLPKALRIGRFLFKFPYVRGVGISGSLSKMYADEKADIDFFIITKANRLWIARSLMHLFKKLTYLTGKQHFYCMNYYLDEKALKLQDENIYTAVETITLLPVTGEGLHNFFEANHWVGNWFADFPLQQNHEQKMRGAGWLKKTVEWMLNNKAGNRFDDYLMKLTTRRWINKQQRGKKNEEGKTMELITGKHFARSNPGMFQEKLLLLYHKKIKELNQ